nr:deoxyribonuclease V [Ardenticatena sp.]
MRPEWSFPPEQAIEWQRQLRQQLIIADAFSPPRLIGGVDAAYVENQALAVIVVLSFPELQKITHTVATVPHEYPYIPGLLSMREGPAIEAAWHALPEEQRPDLLMFDGHGIAHPRGIGIASHMGLLFDRPSIGVAKRILRGDHAPVPNTVGAWQPLVYRGKVVGAAVRTKAGVKPMYVSPGHRISLESAIRFVLATTRGYKLPEPTRLADKLAAEAKRHRAS